MEWSIDCKEKLMQIYGKKKGDELANKYLDKFSIDYFNHFSTEDVLLDIEALEKINPNNSFYLITYSHNNQFHIRIYQYFQIINLSNITNILNNLSTIVLNEQSYFIKLENTEVIIHDFIMDGFKLSHQQDVTINLNSTFKEILNNTIENDKLNSLILQESISPREVNILRTYAQYLHQLQHNFTDNGIYEALITYSNLSLKLICLFKNMFDPHNKIENRNVTRVKLEKELVDEISLIDNSATNKTFRYIFTLIRATLRTNYFLDENTIYTSIKIATPKLPVKNVYKILNEIFVYSPLFEGIYLRTEKISRGGVFFSNRMNDYRSETITALERQKLKNSLITPSAAKGALIIKRNEDYLSLEKKLKYYKEFISALVELTDNLSNNEIIINDNLIALDGEDFYLIPTDNDSPRELIEQNGAVFLEKKFWIYDWVHENRFRISQEIQAKGCFESIKRAFLDLNLAWQQEFTVLAIGNINNPLLSQSLLFNDKMKILAGFDDDYIFIDPKPDPKLSYQERKHLKITKASSWSQYNRNSISKGGGVFKRTNESILLSQEIKSLINFEQNEITPNELIRYLLKLPVDLWWNSGQGIYVKSSLESENDLEDRINRFIRINANELSCRVIAENVYGGLTPKARVEYALNNGYIHSDFIDCSAGLNYLDRNINIKILLDDLTNKKAITQDDKNKILDSIRNEIQETALKESALTAFSISLSYEQSLTQFELIDKYIGTFISSRNIKLFPSAKELLERKVNNNALTLPEVCLLHAYTKNYLKSEILHSTVPQSLFSRQIILNYFPSSLNTLYVEEITNHLLYPEIVSKEICNKLVNEMGITFVFLLQEEMGAKIHDIVLAYLISDKIFNVGSLFDSINDLPQEKSKDLQYELASYVQNLVMLSTRWFLNNINIKKNTDYIIEVFKNGINILWNLIPHIMSGITKHYLQNLVDLFENLGFSKEEAYRLGAVRALYSTLNIIQLADEYDFDLVETAKLYFEVGVQFHLLWIRDQLNFDFSLDFWTSYSARIRLRDALDLQQRLLTQLIMQFTPIENDPKQKIETWGHKNRNLMSRWNKTIARLLGIERPDFLLLFIAVGELANLTRNIQQ